MGTTEPGRYLATFGGAVHRWRTQTGPGADLKLRVAMLLRPTWEAEGTNWLNVSRAPTKHIGVHWGSLPVLVSADADPRGEARKSLSCNSSEQQLGIPQHWEAQAGSRGGPAAALILHPLTA